MALEKERLIAKLNIKDYNRELENILLKKDFSETTKNLLLSMLYKIENSYEDYKKVKVEVLPKKEFLENILEIIKNDCTKIELIKPSLEENKTKSYASKKNKKIVTYQNELNMLEEILSLNSESFSVKSKDEIKGKALENMLTKGENLYQSEIIRDFDGWSWNSLKLEQNEYTVNLIYQLMVFLVGLLNLNDKKHIEILELKEVLKKCYKSNSAERAFELLCEISILNYINENPKENEKIVNMKVQLEQTLQLMENKKEYIEEITNQKKKCIKEIEKIDKYINDDLALKKEYIKQNEKLPQEERVFSLSDFSEIVQERRKKLSDQIQELTEKIKPKNYLKEKTSIENNLKFIIEIEENKGTENLIYEFVNVFFKLINSKINKLELKKEIIEELYILRYVGYININENDKIKDKFKKQIEKTEKNLINIGCNKKIFNIFSKDTEENFKIYRNVFNTRIIDLESAYVEITRDEIIQIYDENSLEKEEKDNKFNDLIVKYNKKIKIFL